MKLFKQITAILLTLSFFLLPAAAYAATSPGLGLAESFVILSNTYTNTVSGTTLNGDLGYTVPPATAPTVNGNTHMADATYDQAGIDQGTALANLNNQPCTFEFAPGAVDLATDTTHGPVGVYEPGVYCVSGAASIGGGSTITLDGEGTYIFRMDGALTTSADSVVTLADGASACDVWWTPTAATTLGANSTFSGTDIDASGITIGNNVTWTGRALAFGGTVSTDTDTISSPICTTSTDDGDDDGTSGGTGGSGGNTSGISEATASLAATGTSVSDLVMVSCAIMTLAIGLYIARRKLYV